MAGEKIISDDLSRQIDLPHLLDVAVAAECLLEPVTITVPNAVVYTNVATYRPEFAAHLAKDIYISRESNLKGVFLAELPAQDTIVFGGEQFALKVGCSLVADQYPIFFSRTQSRIQEVLQSNQAIEDVPESALLLSRYGIFTWGHWLGELLPKAALVEATYPGRFAYVLPFQVVADDNPNLPWLRIKQSLAAYGIGDDRLLPIRQDRNYRFSRLFGVTPVWSDHLIHPGVVKCLRAVTADGSALSKTARLAVDRVPMYGRSLDNQREIQIFLRAAGFVVEQTGTMSFIDQVSIFSRSQLIFGVLGSDLTNLIYAPSGANVITVAPAIFGDRFFYGLILAVGGKYIDLRGPIIGEHMEIPHKSTFEIELQEVVKAVGYFS